jgi:hypothetical protein
MEEQTRAQARSWIKESTESILEFTFSSLERTAAMISLKIYEHSNTIISNTHTQS